VFCCIFSFARKCPQKQHQLTVYLFLFQKIYVYDAILVKPFSRLVLQMSDRDANKNGNCFILFFQFFSYQDLGVVYDFTSNRVSNEMQSFFRNKYLKSIILTRIFYPIFNLSKMKKVISQLLIFHK
jgi:hypothetical protein